MSALRRCFRRPNVAAVSAAQRARALAKWNLHGTGGTWRHDANRGAAEQKVPGQASQHVGHVGSILMTSEGLAASEVAGGRRTGAFAKTTLPIWMAKTRTLIMTTATALREAARRSPSSFPFPVLIRGRTSHVGVLVHLARMCRVQRGDDDTSIDGAHLDRMHLLRPSANS